MAFTELDRSLYQCMIYGGGFALRLKKQKDGSRKFESRVDIKQILTADLEQFIIKLDYMMKEQYRAVENYNSNRDSNPNERVRGYAMVDEVYVVSIVNMQEQVKKEIKQRTPLN